MLRNLEKRIERLEMETAEGSDRLVIKGEAETDEDFQRRLLKLRTEDPFATRLVIE